MPRFSIPWLTVVMVMASLLASLSPQLALLLQYDRAAIAQGDVWRLLTGNFTHWGHNHLFWDLSTFAFFLLALELGLIGERVRRGVLGFWILFGSLCISLGVYWIEPHFDFYRGLSGLSVGGFVLLCITVAKDAVGSGDRLWTYLSGVGLLVVCLKMLYEYCSGQVLFVNDVFAVAVVSHLVGCISAVLVYSARTLISPFPYRT